MSNFVSKSRIKAIEEACGMYLSPDQEDGISLYDAYQTLLAINEDETIDGEQELAMIHVDLWVQMNQSISVNELLELIDANIIDDHIPEFIKAIDWNMLREQKSTILMINHNNKLAKDQIDALDGIVNLIDNLQDTAVDTYGIAEEQVFGESEYDDGSTPDQTEDTFTEEFPHVAESFETPEQK